MSEVGGSDSLCTYRIDRYLRIDGVRWKGFPMSQSIIVNRSQLLAAATAITAVGFLTVSPPAQAHPMLPLGPACSQYGFPGDFSLKQSNGPVVRFNATGPVASGTATATGA